MRLKKIKQKHYKPSRTCLRRIEKQKSDLRKTRQELLDKGVPEQFIIYAIVNEKDEDGIHDTLGIWFETLSEALQFLDDEAKDTTCELVMNSGPPFDCFALDGTDFANMMTKLASCIKDDEEGWQMHVEKYTALKKQLK